MRANIKKDEIKNNKILREEKKKQNEKCTDKERISKRYVAERKTFFEF